MTKNKAEMKIAQIEQEIFYKKAKINKNKN